MASTKAKSLGGADQIIGQAAVKVAPNKPIEAFENMGEPSLVDVSGNIWLTDLHREKGDQVNIFRGGKVAQKIQIPGFRNGKLFCDPSGSVYAETESGLQHLVADGSAFDQFRVAGLLPYPSDLKRLKLMGYSSKGGVVYASGSELHLRRLSEDSP